MDVRRFPRALTKGFIGVAGLMTAAALSVHLASYGPDVIGPTLINVALALFPIVFLVFGPGVVVISLARIPLERVLAGLPLYVNVILAAVVIYVFVDFFLMFHALPGQPEQDGQNFYFNDHGSLIPISADAYRTGLMHAARLFSGHELIFFGFATLLAYQLDAIRTGRVRLEVVPRDEVIERSPMPYPLSRVVGLQTALSPQACAARLLIPASRPAWSFLATSQGLRGQASATEFRVEIAGPQSQLVYAVGRIGGSADGTSIRLLMTFKRWPLVVFAASIILAPLGWAFMVESGFPLPWHWLVIALVISVGGNFLFGLNQRRRLLAEIKGAIEASEIPSNDPQVALLTW